MPADGQMGFNLAFKELRFHTSHLPGDLEENHKTVTKIETRYFLNMKHDDYPFDLEIRRLND